MSNNQAREQAIKAIRDKAMLVKKIFGTSDGEKLMEILEKEFNSDNLLAVGDPHVTHYNLGRRDVVMYLKQLQRFDK